MKQVRVGTSFTLRMMLCASLFGAAGHEHQRGRPAAGEFRLSSEQRNSAGSN